MEDVKNVRVEACEKSRFIRPLRLRYEQDKKEKVWDVVVVHASIYIMIYNVTRKKLVFVKQFRPAVYFSAAKKEQMTDPSKCGPGSTLDTSITHPSVGVTLEVCAGIVDKDKPLVDCARDEVLEECGYKIPAAQMEELSSCFSSVGTGGDKATFFYAEVTDEMRVSAGGGLEEEGELIDVVEMGIEEVEEMVKPGKTVNTSPATLFGIMWFLLNKKK